MQCGCLTRFAGETSPESVTMYSLDGKPLYETVRIVAIDNKTGAVKRNSAITALFCPWCGKRVAAAEGE